jgi:hypothetical protein
MGRMGIKLSRLGTLLLILAIIGVPALLMACVTLCLAKQAP